MNDLDTLRNETVNLLKRMDELENDAMNLGVLMIRNQVRSRNLTPASIMIARMLMDNHDCDDPRVVAVAMGDPETSNMVSLAQTADMIASMSEKYDDKN